MNNKRNELLAGTFIVLSIVLILAIIVGIKGFAQIFQPDQTRTARFTLADDLGGLRAGDDVRIGGFKVGEIRSIELVQDPLEGASAQPHILVTFTVPEKYELREDARIGVQGTLTGTSWLNFSSLGEGAKLNPGIALVGRPSEFGAVVSSIADAVPDVKNLVKTINDKTLPRANDAIASLGTVVTKGNETLTRIDRHIDPIVERYSRVADGSAKVIEQIDDALADNRPRIDASLENASVVSGELKQRMPGLLDQASKVLSDVETALASATKSLDDLKVTAENARELSGSARGIVASNRGRIDDMAKSLKDTGDNLKAASSEIRRSPWRLLYKPKPDEVANLNLFDSARQFADGASELNDAASALRDALQDPTLDEQRLQKLMDHLDSTFQHFNEVEQELWSEVR